MKTAIVSALVMFGIAIAISMTVAALMKLLFVAIRRLQAARKS